MTYFVREQAIAPPQDLPFGQENSRAKPAPPATVRGEIIDPSLRALSSALEGHAASTAPASVWPELFRMWR